MVEILLGSYFADSEDIRFRSYDIINERLDFMLWFKFFGVAAPHSEVVTDVVAYDAEWFSVGLMSSGKLLFLINLWRLAFILRLLGSVCILPVWSF